MAAYNAERYLRMTLRSIQEQTLRDFEVVVVDDGSQDRTRAILKEFATTDSRFTILNQANAGQAAALNYGLQQIRADLIARLDADDLAFPQRLERQVAYMRAHPEVVALGTAVQLIDSSGWTIGTEKNPTEHKEIDRQLLAGIGGILNAPSSMLRTSAVREVGGFRPQYPSVEDLDLCLRLAEVGRLANLPETLTAYRKHLSSANFAGREKMVRLARQVTEEAAVRRGCQLPNFELADYKPSSLSGYHREWALLALQSQLTSAVLKHVWLALWKGNFHRDDLRFAKYALHRLTRSSTPVSSGN